MKRTILTLLFGLLLMGMGNAVMAQKYHKSSYKRFHSQWQRAHDQGSFRVHVGVGAPSLLSANTKALEGFGDIKKRETLPVHISAEYGFSEKFSGGLYVGYSHQEVAWLTSHDEEVGGNAVEFGWEQEFIIIGVRSSYHFNGGKKTKFDPYVSGMIGYNIAGVELGFSGENELNGLGTVGGQVSSINYSVNLGMNYMFSDNIGVFAEVGYGVALANVGLTLGM
ncbi:MAG: hypothetical protein ACPGJS_22810 [Flammeovirgaceae bacterium]